MDDITLNHLPPQNLEIEASIISRAILSSGDMDIISDLISPSDFYRTSHKIIFESCLELFHRGDPIDLVTVAEKLREQKKLEEIGGASFLSKITDIPMAVSIEHACRKVREKARLRQIIGLCNEYVQKAFEDGGETETLIDEMQRDFSKIDLGVGDDDVEKVDGLLMSYIDKLEELSHRDVTTTGYKTGFKLLDYITCGWQKSDLIIIAARPSMGKSSLAFRLAMNMAGEGIPGLLFNLEMSKEQVIMRMAAMESRVDAQKMRRGKLSDTDWDRITSASGRITRMPLFIHDQPSLHYNQIRRIARRQHKLNGIKFIFIDHLQLAKGDFPKEPFHDTGSITGPLKALAKELNMPVFVLSQLNRELEKRSNKRPIMSDLRNSGNIEQDADVVMFIYRDEKYNDAEDNPEKGKAEIDVAKQRNGPPGMVKTAFLGHCMDFVELQYTDCEWGNNH